MDGFLLEQCSEVVSMRFKRGREARRGREAEIFSSIKIIDTAIQSQISDWNRNLGAGERTGVSGSVFSRMWRY